MSRTRASAKAAGTCLRCGAENPPQELGQPRKYCSDECRALHYNESRRQRRGPRPTVEQRLAAKLLPVPTGCKEFTGHRNEHGYGVIRWAGSAALAHRVAWSLVNGPVPDGMCVCHTCDNPPCCETSHLFLGTHLDNMRDRDAKGRTLRGADLRWTRWGR